MARSCRLRSFLSDVRFAMHSRGSLTVRSNVVIVENTRQYLVE
jgi:hypothetical protein